MFLYPLLRFKSKLKRVECLVNVHVAGESGWIIFSTNLRIADLIAIILASTCLGNEESDFDKAIVRA